MRSRQRQDRKCGSEKKVEGRPSVIVGEQVAEKLLLGTPRGPVRGGTGDEIRKVWRGWMNQMRGMKTGDRVEGKEVVCLSEEWL